MTSGELIISNGSQQNEEQTNSKQKSVTDEKSDTDLIKLGHRVLLAAEKNRLLELAHYTGKYPSLINFRDEDKYTPLHRASYGGHLDCAKYLVKHGANVNAKTNDDWTPLHSAVRWNNINIVEYLLRQNADVNALSNGGNSPLHIVATNGKFATTGDIIQLLLYHPNCDYTIKNNSGDTAFDLAKRSGPFYKLWSGVMTIFPDDMEIEENDRYIDIVKQED